jgi:hypothetical protein
MVNVTVFGSSGNCRGQDSRNPHSSQDQLLFPIQFFVVRSVKCQLLLLFFEEIFLKEGLKIKCEYGWHLQQLFRKVDIVRPAALRAFSDSGSPSCVTKTSPH